MKVVTTFILFVSILLRITLSVAQKSTKASEFKAPNTKNPKEIVEQWKQEDKELWDYVSAQVPAVLNHTGSAAFDEHLKGVQAMLRFWNAPSHVTSAGLFHSIYGTEGFQGFSLPLTERSSIQNLIGKEAEQLCYWFCMVDRSTVDKSVFDWKRPLSKSKQIIFQSRPELGRFSMTLNREEWLDFIELTLADWLEQVEGASEKPSSLFLWKQGEAYAYRRLAYKKMSQILSVERPQRLSRMPIVTLSVIMGTEDSSTRHLVQPRTPPMSKEAEEALQALRDAGEDIPVDLSPQPVEELRVVEEHKSIPMGELKIAAVNTEL